MPARCCYQTLMAKRPSQPLPLSSVNHISLLCSSIETSSAFYENVLGFVPIRRPRSFDFDGAWLFNHGIGIHLIQAPNPCELPKKTEINPKDNHMSFQTECQDIGEVEERLRELGVQHVRVGVEELGIRVEQIFFHDPDGYMIEVCTCDNLPLVPLKSSPWAHSVASCSCCASKGPDVVHPACLTIAKASDSSTHHCVIIPVDTQNMLGTTTVLNMLGTTV